MYVSPTHTHSLFFSLSLSISQTWPSITSACEGGGREEKALDE